VTTWLFDIFDLPNTWMLKEPRRSFVEEAMDKKKRQRRKGIKRTRARRRCWVKESMEIVFVFVGLRRTS
jgi:hypothetical protein